jgi:ketosteroid isomerase-like protein
MSEQNVELHRRAAAAFTSGDVEAFIACFDPSVEFHTEFAEMGGLYYGHDGLRRFLRDFEDAWGGEMRIEPEAYFDLGETTLLFLVARARGSRSGAAVVMSTAHAIRWRDGLVISFRGYAGRDGALADLGVSQDALDAIDP